MNIVLATSAEVLSSLQTWLIGAGQIAIALTAICGAVWAFLRFAVLRPLDRRIADATKQIQPGANGGQSLTDVNKKVDKLTENVEALGKRLDHIEERSFTIYEHVLDLTERYNRRSKRRNSVEDEPVEE